MNKNHKTGIGVEDHALYRYSDTLPATSRMLDELLRTSEIQQLFDSYYSLIKIPVAIIDLNANVLLSSRWQRICTQFHRVNPETCAHCIECDTKIALQIKKGQTYTIYPCYNGLTDCASPIIIEGNRVANLFIGQFMTKKPDEARFRRQAEKYGFDVNDYLAAMREVPIIDEKNIHHILDLLSRMTRVITNLSIERKHAIDDRSRQSLILDAIPQSVFWKDLQGKYLGCNAPFAQSAGLASTASILGKTDFDLPWPRVDAEAYRKDDQAVISSNQPILHITEPLQKADGSRIVIDTSKIPLIDASNRTYGVVGVYDDITERKKLEEILKNSEEKFRLSFMTSQDAYYWSAFEEGRFLEINPIFEKLFGYSRAEVIGKTSLELGLYENPSDRDRVFAELRTKGFVKDMELTGKKKDGKFISISISISRTSIDEQSFILGVIRDITDQKKNQIELQNSLFKLRQTVEGTIETIALIVEARDPYTAGHQKRVTDISVKVAEEMHLPEEQIQGIRMAGLIHDLGKIQVPAELLSKPGRLTELEFELIKVHPQVGFELLKGIEFPWPIAEIIHQHHERMDGSGYPCNLKGDEILLEARIISIADVIEAMSSHRPYRPALGLDEALSEVKKNKGHLYDEQVSNAFLKVFKKGYRFN